jgi:hypothetical protein
LPTPSVSTEHKELQQAWESFIRERELAAETKFVTTRSNKHSKGDTLKSKKVSMDKPATRTVSASNETTHTLSRLHVYTNEEIIEHFKEGYRADKNFSAIVAHMREEKVENDKYHVYQLGSNGLLHFKDADHRIRLCVPLSERISLIKEVHDSAHESAHAGWE